MSQSASKQVNSSVPLLQIAMDYITIPPALAMAVKVADEVDIIEIGTPLCKAAGLEAIRSMREICPDKLILADFKTPDVGGLEAKMAFDAGADMMTVIGGAPLATVQIGAGRGPQAGQRDADGTDRACAISSPGPQNGAKWAWSGWSTIAAGMSRTRPGSGTKTIKTPSGS